VQMQEGVEGPAQQCSSRHQWHSNCAGRLPGLDCQERCARRTGLFFTAFWVRLGGDTSRGLNPTDVSTWDGALEGTHNTHFTNYIRLYKTGSFWKEDHKSRKTIYNILVSTKSFGKIITYHATFMWLPPQMVARKQLFLSSWSGRQMGRPPISRTESPLHMAPLMLLLEPQTDLPERLPSP